MGLALAVGLIGGAFSAYQSIQQARAQESMYKAQAQEYQNQAKVAENNRLMSERQASQTLEEGAREERRFRLRARDFQAAQESRLAASGASVGGSALNVMADTAGGIEEDAAMIRYDTLKQKWGFDVDASNYGYQAETARVSAQNAMASAKNAKKAGMFGAVTSLLGGAVSGFSSIDAKAAGNTISIGTGSVGGGMNYPGFGVSPFSGASYGSMYYSGITGNKTAMSDAAYRRLRAGWR